MLSIHNLEEVEAICNCVIVIAEGRLLEGLGKEIELNHVYAIVCAEKMNKDMILIAPLAPTCIESMVNYAIATQLAGYITNLGNLATANHYRHYDNLYA